MMEIQAALKNALDAVGNEGSYVCVFDIAGGVPFINTSICEDVTKKVRTKLGIPANAVPASVPAK
jgi:outer membrane protein